MNKKWTEQKYIVHFLLSVLVITLSSGAALGMDACRKESVRAGEVGAEADEAIAKGKGCAADMPAELSKYGWQLPYMASGQRMATVRTLSMPKAAKDAAENPEAWKYDKEAAAGWQDDETYQAEDAAEEAISGLLTAAGDGGGQILSKEDYEALLRIVQAEAGNEDIKGRILVANVVLNRVADERFPMSVCGVVFQKANGRAQFSPISDGTYYRVEVSPETKEAVDRALAGEDYSEGALYFAARQYAGKGQMRWFDECLQKLFVYGGHEFFKG